MGKGQLRAIVRSLRRIYPGKTSYLTASRVLKERLAARQGTVPPDQTLHNTVQFMSCAAARDGIEQNIIRNLVRYHKSHWEGKAQANALKNAAYMESNSLIVEDLVENLNLTMRTCI